MKKKLFRYATLVVAAVLSASAFVGCSADEEDEDNLDLSTQEVKSVKLYDRFGKKLCDLTAEEMDAWDGYTEPAADYWYEIQIEGSNKVYTGHFTSIKGEN